jgi:hypothetical protein
MTYADPQRRREYNRKQKARYNETHRHPCPLCGSPVGYQSPYCRRCGNNLRSSRQLATGLPAEAKRLMAMRAARALLARGRVEVRLLNGYRPPAEARSEVPPNAVAGP